MKGATIKNFNSLITIIYNESFEYCNPLKNMQKKNQLISHRKHSVSLKKTVLLINFKGIIVVNVTNEKTQNALCGRAEFGLNQVAYCT